MTLAELIPLLQTLVWIIFIVGILIVTRKYVSAFLHAIVKNVERGSSVETPWLKIQSVPKQEDASVGNLSPMDKARSVYLRHTAGPWEKQSDGVERKPIRIWLDSSDSSIWDKIVKITYYLPTSFPDHIREKTNDKEQYLMKTAAYGEFTVGAEIILKNEKEPWRINRYINFFDKTSGREGVLSEDDVREILKEMGLKPKMGE